MTITIIILIAVGVLLIILSLFTKTKHKELEDQLEQLSISTMEDTYRIRKKVKMLEDLILSEKEIPQETSSSNKVSMQPLLNQKVYHLHQQGYSLTEIIKQTNLSESDIHSILNNNK